MSPPVQIPTAISILDPHGVRAATGAAARAVGGLQPTGCAWARGGRRGHRRRRCSQRAGRGLRRASSCVAGGARAAGGPQPTACAPARGGRRGHRRRRGSRRAGRGLRRAGSCAVGGAATGMARLAAGGARAAARREARPPA